MFASLLTFDLRTAAQNGFRAVFPVILVWTLTACDVELRKTDAQLGLNPIQSAGRKVYNDYCDRCHQPYSSRAKKGPSLKGVFQRQYLPVSGLPANDERVGEIVRLGREKMPGFAQALSSEQISNLLAYLHTL
ncbi:MAG: cytochrome c [Acidobacteriales bacterium]|nr:cytochrome c [Terriglobales bacterium]